MQDRSQRHGIHFPRPDQAMAKRVLLRTLTASIYLSVEARSTFPIKARVRRSVSRGACYVGRYLREVGSGARAPDALKGNEGNVLYVERWRAT